MAKKKGHGEGGGHGGAWIITFADLVSLLMAFFVMIVSFSVQDEQKVAQAAGSIRDAFGVQRISQPAGIIEIDGLPVRKYLRDLGAVESQAQGNNENASPYQKNFGNFEQQARNYQEARGDFNSIAMTLQSALNEDPALQDSTGNVLMEETADGLLIELIDTDGRSMFGAGGSAPSYSAEMVIAKIAPILDELPNTVRVTGHTSTDTADVAFDAASKWMLSARRAEAARTLLTVHGLSPDHLSAIIGMADTDPLWPDNPQMAGNRRVSILLERTNAAYPSDLRP